MRKGRDSFLRKERYLRNKVQAHRDDSPSPWRHGVPKQVSLNSVKQFVHSILIAFQSGNSILSGIAIREIALRKSVLIIEPQVWNELSRAADHSPNETSLQKKRLDETFVFRSDEGILLFIPSNPNGVPERLRRNKRKNGFRGSL